MKEIVLGKTGIRTPQNAFGALPIQRRDLNDAVRILRKAVDGGMVYFDTARAYTDSEEKLGKAFQGIRDKVFLATKTTARTPEKLKEDLETSLKTLQTDYIDVYQLHMAGQCYRPGDGTGLYEALEEAKREGKIRHIGITAHKIGVAEEIAKSGLYETLQFPFSYLASERDIRLVQTCEQNQVGFVCMKGLAGGLITNAAAAMAFIAQYDHILPIWGIQKDEELEEWLSFMEQTPEITEELAAYIQKEQQELSGDFCRGCGYCMPCPQEIQIPSVARMALLLRRAPSDAWLSENWQAEMKKIESCIECRQCVSRCPYELDTPALLKKNLEDYQRVLAGEISVK